MSSDYFTRHYTFSFPFENTIPGLSVTLASMDSQKGEEPNPGSMEVASVPGSASSPQSDAVTSELQELSLQPAPNLLPIQERKNGETVTRMTFVFFSHHRFSLMLGFG